VTDPVEAGFAAIADALGGEADVTAGTGFGTMPGLRTGGKIFAMLHDGALVLKLPADRCAGLVADGVAVPFGIGTRKMREWVSIASPDGLDWPALAGEARAFVRGR
jgi:hypothetical protein